MQTTCMHRSADPSLSPYTHVSPACPVGSSPLYNHILYGLKPGIICPRYKSKALIPVYRNALSFSPLLQNPNPKTLHFPKTCGSYFVLIPSFLPQSASQTTFRISRMIQHSSPRCLHSAPPSLPSLHPNSKCTVFPEACSKDLGV